MERKHEFFVLNEKRSPKVIQVHVFVFVRSMLLDMLCVDYTAKDDASSDSIDSVTNLTDDHLTWIVESSLLIISLGSCNRLRHTGMKADNLGHITKLLAVGVDATTSSVATVQRQEIPPHEILLRKLWVAKRLLSVFLRQVQHAFHTEK